MRSEYDPVTMQEAALVVRNCVVRANEAKRGGEGGQAVIDVDVACDDF